MEGACICDEAYEGERCEHRSCTWMAANRPCANEGRCFNGTCTCPKGYTGDRKPLCAGLSRAIAQRQLRVLVFGTSMSGGHGLPSGDRAS